VLYIDERNLLAAPGPAYIRRTGGGRGEFTTAAAFASADWRLSETLTLSTGVRYTHEEKDAIISRVRRAEDNLDGALTPVGEGVAGGDIDTRTLNFSDEPFALSWNDTSPRVALQWRPNAETNIYASWSRAVRSGGVNFRTSTLGTPTLAQPPQAYDSEEVTTYELGWKQDVQNGRGRVNLALFQNTIEHMQRETNVPGVSAVQQIVLNAGDATIYGGEIEAFYDLTSAVTLSAYAGYTHGAYDRITADLTGDLLINAADYALEIPRLAPWTYGLTAEYRTGLAGGEIAVRASYNHRDAAFYSDNNRGRLAEADIVDANIVYEPASGHWAVALYGENLNNEATWGGDTLLPSTPAFGFGGGEAPTFSPLNKGRVFGLELRFHY
jgi:iron complex outermembrane receptor protein